jgi:hypothetical protein
VGRGARTGAQWTSERGLRVADVGRIWVGRAGEASYRAALAEAARLGTVTLVPLTPGREREQAPARGVGDATRIAADGSEASVAVVGPDAGMRTEESAAEGFVDADPPAGQAPVSAGLAASVRAGAIEQTVVASATASEAKRARRPSKRDEAQGETKLLDAPAAEEDEPPEAPVQEARGEAGELEVSAGEVRERADAPSGTVAEGQGETVGVAPAGDADEPTDAPSAQPKEANEWKNVASAGEANESTGASVALAAEAMDRVDAPLDATERNETPRAPGEPIRGTKEADAVAGPGSRARKRSGNRADVAPEPTEPATAGDAADAAGGSPRRRTRAKRKPRTTTPQGERSPQQSR